MRSNILLGLFAVFATFILLGCLGPANETGDNVTPNGNGGNGLPPVPPVFIPGSVELVVESCDGTSLRTFNNGTGSIILNSTTYIQSSEGFTTLGQIFGSYFIQPGQVITVQLPRDLYDEEVQNLTNSNFRLDIRMQKPEGGTQHYYAKFVCQP